MLIEDTIKNSELPNHLRPTIEEVHELKSKVKENLDKGMSHLDALFSSILPNWRKEE